MSNEYRHTSNEYAKFENAREPADEIELPGKQFRRIELPSNRVAVTRNAGRTWQYYPKQYTVLNDEAVEHYTKVIRAVLRSRRIYGEHAKDIVQEALTRVVARMRNGLPSPHVLSNYFARTAGRLALRCILHKRKEEKAIACSGILLTGFCSQEFICEVNEALKMSDRKAAEYFGVEKTAIRRSMC